MRFTANPLKALDAIYQFVEGLTGLREFQLEGSIIPVHDLSREAEIGSGLSQAIGYFIEGTLDVHAAAGVIRTTHDPWDQVDTQRGPNRRNNYAVWLMDVFGICTDQGNFLNASSVLSYPTIPDALAAENKILAAFNTTVQTGTIAAEFNLEETVGVYLRGRMPVFIPDGSTIAMQTEAQTADNNITLNHLYWAGARNTLPPGVA